MGSAKLDTINLGLRWLAAGEKVSDGKFWRYFNLIRQHWSSRELRGTRQLRSELNEDVKFSGYASSMPRRKGYSVESYDEPGKCWKSFLHFPQTLLSLSVVRF